jgi:hypothetical protein
MIQLTYQGLSHQRQEDRPQTRPSEALFRLLPQDWSLSHPSEFLWDRDPVGIGDMGLGLSHI